MLKEVTVHVNRGAADSLESTVDSIDTRDSFDCCLQSHGTPAHVHCRLAGDLARIASLETANYYVEADSETYVAVRVDAEAIDEPVTGALEVLTGYGSESISIPVTVRPPPKAVDVDESLAEPSRPDADRELTPLERAVDATGLEPATLAVVAVGLAAAAVGAVTAATIGGTVATLGLAIVTIGVVVAIGLLVR
ncbi:DUF7524 family protein [Natronolimnohabitans innermongolicus]|uniref:Uncharacterized protein n=1 Tax=Natronolimnohabitans innermongolicus JCM 12255 TaxID=1227499 RepID=L9XHP8_9EURY|nr:hypothetical protein [Natronolimnohabitans innermongolicus]ELY61240.1 hypothetical protein C493_02963 [Natronolimnohabitans innermongolicus JCM 12255]